MNEVKNVYHLGCRWDLLISVSVVALIGSGGVVEAAGDDAGHPQLWIELGGQMERIGGRPDQYAPAFFSLASPGNLAPLIDAQRPSPNGFGEEGKVTVTPSGSHWEFSAGVRYGRSRAQRHLHHNSPAATGLGPIYVGSLVITSDFKPANLAYGDGQTDLTETHLIVDFKAGRDVGLGLFGAHSSSVVSAGVRFAQFTNGTDVNLHARPVYNMGFASVADKYRIPQPSRANYTAVLHAERSTHALGPSLSWDASLPLTATDSDATLNLDWSMNAGLLFGRQKASVRRQTSGYHYRKYGGLSGGKDVGSYVNAPPDQKRSHSVTIPNLGGSVGLSVRYGEAKLRLGYRADFFFGALDSGIDTRRTQTIGFYGPFANISVGLGG